MGEKLIYGIQQVGIGVENIEDTFKWYAEVLGANVSLFDDSNTSTHMMRYMGGKPHKKRAILALNLHGGGGYEFWQYMDRKPEKPHQEFKIGDLGINMIFVKSRNVGQTYTRLKEKGENILENGIRLDLDLERCLHLKDPAGNILKIKECNTLFADEGGRIAIGGICGCTIGVRNIDESLPLYTDILGYNKVLYDVSKDFFDLHELPGGQERFRRVLLGHEPNRQGGFGKFLGASQIELIQKLESKPKKIYANRFWGDIGFMHLSFDIQKMDALIDECSKKGYPFTVLSPMTYRMGNNDARWGYIEDNDGTIIGFIETHKIPLIKKLGLNIDMTKRDPKKPIPKWMIKALILKRFQPRN